MATEFNYGPFAFVPGQRIQVNGRQTVEWEMRYGTKFIAARRLPENLCRPDIADAFGAAYAAFVRDAQPTPAAVEDPLGAGYAVRLVSSTDSVGQHGGVIDSFLCLAPIAGMSAGMIDDRYPTWIVSDIGAVEPMGEEEFMRLKAAHEAIKDALLAGHKPAPRKPNAWISSLLPGDVLTQDPEHWRAPTAWEIRHIVGEGSFTSITGAAAAALVGVTPQNFRKYTAQDGARTRQNMSFAMWHLLLHRLGVQEMLGSGREN